MICVLLDKFQGLQNLVGKCDIRSVIVSLSDGIGDFLTRIRNAQLAMHRETRVLFSKVNSSILKILKEEGYILNYEKQESDSIPSLFYSFSINPTFTYIPNFIIQSRSRS